MAAAGLVFQFPERHFIGRTLGEELTVGWPQGPEWAALAARASQVLAVVGLSQLPIDVPLASLSDGYKRWVAGGGRGALSCDCGCDGPEAGGC